MHTDFPDTGEWVCSLRDSGQHHLHSFSISLQHLQRALYVLTHTSVRTGPTLHIYLNPSQMATYTLCPVSFSAHCPYYRRLYSVSSCVADSWWVFNKGPSSLFLFYCIQTAHTVCVSFDVMFQSHWGLTCKAYLWCQDTAVSAPWTFPGGTALPQTSSLFMFIKINS